MMQSHHSQIGIETGTATATRFRKLCVLMLLLFVAVGVPLLLSTAVLAFRADPFNPAPFPDHEFTRPPSLINAEMLQRSIYIGSGRVVGPEDLAYDPASQVIYTGCADGWVKRLKLNESVVEDFINTGGRPLGVALSAPQQLIVADAYKGLLRVSSNKKIELLTDRAEGLKLKLTDGVDVSADGTIYFTDASYKYDLSEHLSDIFEYRPYGRLLSFNPSTNETKVLLRDLYFPNGVAISPDQDSLVFCETPLKRCRKYWLQGSKKGTALPFIDNLPGYPDNVRYDGEGCYWIGISSSFHPFLEQVSRLQIVRKGIVFMERYVSLLKQVLRNGGIYGVDVQGNPIAHIYDPALMMITGGIKIGDYLYVGSLYRPHVIRFQL